MIDFSSPLTLPNATDVLALIPAIELSTPALPDFSAVLTEMIGPEMSGANASPIGRSRQAIEAEAAKETEKEPKPAETTATSAAGTNLPIAFVLPPTFAPSLVIDCPTPVKPEVAGLKVIEDQHWQDVRKYEYTVRLEAPEMPANAANAADSRFSVATPLPLQAAQDNTSQPVPTVPVQLQQEMNARPSLSALPAQAAQVEPNTKAAQADIAQPVQAAQVGQDAKVSQSATYAQPAQAAQVAQYAQAAQYTQVAQYAQAAQAGQSRQPIRPAQQPVTTDEGINVQQDELPRLPQAELRVVSIDKATIELRFSDRGKPAPPPAAEFRGPVTTDSFAMLTREQSVVEAETVLAAHHVEIPVMPNLQVVRTVSMQIGEADSEVVIRLEERGGDVQLKIDSTSEPLRSELESSVDSLAWNLEQEEVPVTRIDVGEKSLITKVRRMKETK